MDPQQNANPSTSPPEQDSPQPVDAVARQTSPDFTPRSSGGSFRGSRIAPITSSSSPEPVLNEDPPALPAPPATDFSSPTVIPPQQSVPAWTPPAAIDSQPAITSVPTASGSIVPPAPNNFPSANSSPPNGASGGKSKKKLFIGAGVGLVVTALVLGTVFGYYLPNKPENVFKTGMDRSGKVIDKLIDEATEKDKLQQIKKSELQGLIEVSSNQGGSFNGSFNVKLDPTKSDGSFDFKLQESDQPDQTLGLKFLTELQKDKRFPDLYFQLTGLKTLGADAFVPGIVDYDGKWIAVESEYLESLSSGFIPPAEQKNKENISADEIAQLVRVVSDVSNEYLFTADPDKAVFENREYLGKEKTEEGINSFHYKVGVNAPHLVSYCKALSEKFLSQSAVKKIANADDAQIAEYKKSAIKDCDDSGKDIKSDETFEMWIDAKYKIIHKVRVYSEKDKKDAYNDVGQIYTGGDKLALFTKYHRDENNLNIKFTLDVDIKATNSKAELTAKQEGDSGFLGKASISAKPFSGEINVVKPPGAIPIKDILIRFGYDPTYLSGIEENSNPTPPPGSIQAKAKDSERKSDINAIYTQAETYYAENGFYPSLADMNSKSFRSASMRLEDAAFTPPDSTNSSLAAAASASQYGYGTIGCNSAGKQCQGYTLTALLSTGDTYTKTGLN